MPNDAKLGLVIGVSLVVAVGVLFYRKEVTSALPANAKPPTSTVNPLPPPPVRPARLTARAREVSPPAEDVRRHTVVAEETLYTIAERYYGAGERFVDVYQANRDVLKRPDRLEVGTVLVIPNLPSATDAKP